MCKLLNSLHIFCDTPTTRLVTRANEVYRSVFMSVLLIQVWNNYLELLLVIRTNKKYMRCKKYSLFSNFYLLVNFLNNNGVITKLTCAIKIIQKKKNKFTFLIIINIKHSMLEFDS